MRNATTVPQVLQLSTHALLSSAYNGHEVIMKGKTIHWTELQIMKQDKQHSVRIGGSLKKRKYEVIN